MKDRGPAQWVLAIDPTHRGFGYAIFEDSEHLIDWGVRRVRGDKNKASLLSIGELVSHYAPRILVLEDIDADSCRRSPRVRELIKSLELYARGRGLKVQRISRASAKRSFASLGVGNKDQTARFIAARFPELADDVPPVRKPWMSDDPRMAIFDAAASALVSLAGQKKNDSAARLI